ncbi:ABC transporter ATP-binding protein (modular protein) [Rhodococcus ruber]|uniref:ABC transporter ATP-binding protein (Modular protein) n=1 Tax=Rhodococcus ruber TaxID=1830 RepID=A0A098BGM5_9NOCA|nr:ABC transporter ATP-binding protein (modular protein) [Rhodococcus ruber]
MTTAISVKGVEKSYEQLHVLRGVDFEVEAGSIFALLGSNGAGKTTLVKILATLLKSDAGQAAVAGFDVVDDAADVRESISLTGQFAAVDEILSGRENLVLIAKLRHLPDPRVVADQLLERFSLTAAGDRRVSTYSGGMRRRLDIAMSLIGNPPIVFLDEPTTGLDPQARMEVWQVVRDLAARGTTVLLTTQYLEEAEQLADRIAILHEGRIIVDGTSPNSSACFPPRRWNTSRSSPPSKRSSSASSVAAPASKIPVPQMERNRNDHPCRLRHRGPHRTIPAPHHPQPRHHHHDRGHAGGHHVAVRVRPRRRHRHRRRNGHSRVRELPAARHPAHHRRLGCCVHLGATVQRPAGRHRGTIPVDADLPVLGVVVTRPDLTGRQPDRTGHRRRVRRPHGVPFRGKHPRMAHGRRNPHPVHAGADLARGHRRPVGEHRRRRGGICLPAHLPAVRQLRLRAHRVDAGPGAGIRRQPARDVDRERGPRPAHRPVSGRRPVGGPRLVCRHPGRLVHRSGHDLPTQILLTVITPEQLQLAPVTLST